MAYATARVHAVTRPGLTDTAASPKAAVFTIAYSSRRGRAAPPGRASPSTAARARPRCGCTWRARSRSGCRSRRRLDAAPPYAVSDNPHVLVRALRPRVRRSAAHRLSIAASEEARRSCSRRRRRRGAGRGDARLAGRHTALGLADLLSPARATARRAARRSADRLQSRASRSPAWSSCRARWTCRRSSSRRATTCRTRCSCRRSPTWRSTTASCKGGWRSRPRRRARRRGLRRRGLLRRAARRRAARRHGRERIARRIAS
jgi:hypothetical protein